MPHHVAIHPDPERVPAPPPAPQPLAPSSAGLLTYPATPPTEPVFDRLLGERIIYLGGELDEAAAHRLTGQLLLLGAQDPRRDAVLYLHCPGGSAAAALAVHDTMRALRCDVATWVVGLAATVGQFLLTAGTPGKRHALAHSRVVLGQGVARPAGATPAEVLDQMRRELVELTARHTGRSVETVTADVAARRWFTAGQAQAYGLVDHVVGQAAGG